MEKNLQTLKDMIVSIISRKEQQRCSYIDLARETLKDHLFLGKALNELESEGKITQDDTSENPLYQLTPASTQNLEKKSTQVSPKDYIATDSNKEVVASGLNQPVKYEAIAEDKLLKLRELAHMWKSHNLSDDLSYAGRSILAILDQK
jgi:hypothetical protein